MLKSLYFQFAYIVASNVTVPTSPFKFGVRQTTKSEFHC